MFLAYYALLCQESKNATEIHKKDLCSVCIGAETE